MPFRLKKHGFFNARVLITAALMSVAPIKVHGMDVAGLESYLQSGVKGEVRLDQESLVQWVLLRNPSVLISREQLDVANWQLESEEAAYQAELYLTIGRSSDRRLSGVDSDPPVIQDRETLLDTGIRKILPTGAEVTLGYETRGRVNTAPSVTDPEGIDDAIGNLKLELRQPLLRGFNAAQIKGRIAQSGHEIEIAKQRIRQQLLTSSFDALNLYWQLYSSDQAVTNTGKALENTRKLIMDTERLVKAGRLPETALLEARTVLLSREVEHESAKLQQMRVHSALRVLLNLEYGEGEGIIFSTDSSPDGKRWTRPGDMDSYLNDVIAIWPNYVMAQERISVGQQKLEMMRDESKPQLDLLLSYGQSSRNFDANHSRVFQDSWREDYPSWNVALELTMPLGRNRSGQAQTAIARSELFQATMEADSARIQLSQEIRLRMDQLDAAWQELELYREQTKTLEELFSVEQKRFDSGTASVQDWLNRQTELTMGRLRLTDAEVRYELAKAALQLSDGSLLERMGVEFALNTSR